MKIEVSFNGTKREVEVVEGKYGTGGEYYEVSGVVFKTLSGSKLHCGWAYLNKTTLKPIDFIYAGALGNGSGFSSKIVLIDWADKYTADKISKATQYAYVDHMNKFNNE